VSLGAVGFARIGMLGNLRHIAPIYSRRARRGGWKRRFSKSQLGGPLE
jgi:hypothetical protein